MSEQQDQLAASVSTSQQQPQVVQQVVGHSHTHTCQVPVTTYGQQSFVRQSNVIAGPQVVQQGHVQGQSRVEYYPIERREMEYQQVERVFAEQVPRTVVVQDTVERRVVENIPREKIITDYQAIEYQKEYIPRTVYDTVQEQVPVQSTEYVPVVRIDQVPNVVTDYVTQSRQVPRVEYDEVEHRIERGVQSGLNQSIVQPVGVAQTIVQPQVAVAQPLQTSQVVVAQPQVVAQPLATSFVQPQVVAQPMATSFVQPQYVQQPQFYNQQPQFYNQPQYVQQQPQYVQQQPQYVQPQQVAHTQPQQVAPVRRQGEDKGLLDQIFD